MRELVRQKKLTKFQAEQIWQGRGKSLVLGNYLLLEKIEQALAKSPSAAGLLQLAEAFAWIAAPAQPHGGGKN